MGHTHLDSVPDEARSSTSDGLSRIERLALAIARACNRSRRVKRLTHSVNLSITHRLVRLLAGSRVHVLGLDRFDGMNLSRGLLFAPNHRSFFDLYLIMAALAPLVRRANRMYFPVRSTFWYDSALGLVVNALASSLSMYPPIFREASKRSVTREGLDFLATELLNPGVLVGMHPEGRRNRSSDPYDLLAPEQSFGRVVLNAKPVVVPVFINGVGNSLWSECIAALRGRAEPIVIVFGAALDLAEFADRDPSRLRTQIEVGQRALQVIGDLAVEERSYRAALGARGAIPRPPP